MVHVNQNFKTDAGKKREQLGAGNGQVQSGACWQGQNQHVHVHCMYGACVTAPQVHTCDIAYVHASEQKRERELCRYELNIRKQI